MKNKTEIHLKDLISNEKERFEYYKNSPRITKTKTDEKIINYLYEQQISAAATLGMYALFQSILLAQDNFERSQNVMQPCGQFNLIFDEKSSKDEIIAKIVNKIDASKNYDLKIKISEGMSFSSLSKEKMSKNSDSQIKTSGPSDFRFISFKITENGKRIFVGEVHEIFRGRERISKNLVRSIDYTQKTNAFRMLNFFKNLSENASEENKKRLEGIAKRGPVGPLMPFIIADNYTFGENTMTAIRQVKRTLKESNSF